MKKRNEFITETIERVRELIPPSQVIGDDIGLVRKGSGHQGLCPFHNDTKLGSFVVTNSKKMFKCFSCQTGGDVVKYKSLRTGMSYVESALQLAVDYGIITAIEYEEVTALKISAKDNAKIERIFIEKDKEKLISDRAEPEILHKVYSLFIKGYLYTNKKKLSQDHEKHLLENRKLTVEDIEKRGYFTFPNRYITKAFLNDLESNGISSDVLKTIPGFYYDTKKDTWTFHCPQGGGIGIPMINEDGYIYGIQIRKDVVKKGDQRYTWFSSSWAQGNDDLEYGVSSGSPIDVVIPENVKLKKAIFITEGHFKAVRLAKTYNSIAISVQGVGAWSPVVKVIENLKNKYNINNIYITYDADMSYNVGVLKQAMDMGIALSGLNQNDKPENIKKDLNNNNFKPKNNVYFSLWDDELGKGVDDLILNGNKEYISKMEIKNLYSNYENYLNTLKNNYIDGVNVKDFSQIKKTELKNTFHECILSKTQS